jgi:hypothetical protein
MIDTIATAGGFVFIAYVMGQVVQGNLDRRKRIERMDAEMRSLVHQSNVIGMAAWKNSRAQGVGTLRG